MGQPLTAEYTRTIASVAHDRGVPLHVDGARIWNAVVALGARPTDLSGPADSVTFCLSKGLSCPVGSVVVGSREFIWRARRGRKLVGGGMRQAGILAAAGLLALRPGSAGRIDRLGGGRRNARRLAERLATMDGILSAGGSAQPGDGPLDPRRVRTNFVIFRVARDRAAFLAALRARGVWMIDYPHGTVRAVTHYGLTADDIETAIEATAAALAETNRRSLPSEDVSQNADVAGAAVPAGR